MANLETVASEYKNVQGELRTVGDNLKKYHDQTEERHKELNARLTAAEQALVNEDRGNHLAGYFPAAGDPSTRPAFSIRVGNEVLPALANNQRLAQFAPRGTDEGDFSLGDFVRASLGLIRPNATLTGNGGLVPTSTSTQIIDDMRAASTVIQAGSLTIPVGGPVNLCRVDGDATVFQHTEGLADIQESQPTFSALLLEPKALVAAIPISAELVQDSQNLDEALRAALAGAFGAKLDALAIAKILADAAIPISTVSQDPATWQGVLAAVGSALQLDQRLPRAHISAAADFISRASQVASTAGNWLNRPEALREMVELFTTKLTAGTAIFGDFTGFGVAIRQDLRLELIRFQSPTSYSHLLVAHARAEGYVLQPKKLYVQEAVASSGS
jgi:hypothetical protein